jgi:hypothetical protein
MSRLGGQLTVLGELRPIEEQIARWQAVTSTTCDASSSGCTARPSLAVTVGPALWPAARGRRVRSQA